MVISYKVHVHHSQVAEHYQLPEADVHYYHIQNLFLAGEVREYKT